MAISRRSFLYGLGASTLLPSIGWSTGTSTSQDYKALICVYLAGGNDGFNMIIPRDDEHYQNYAAARKTIAINQSELLSVDLTGFDRNGSQVEFGLHPSMSGLKNLCDKGYVNAILNCGVLRQQITKDQKEFAPGMLFSHNSQAAEWFKGNANAKTDNSGWGARLMEQLVSDDASLVLPPLYSLSGHAELFNGNIANNAFNANGVSELGFKTDRIRNSYAASLDSDVSDKSVFHQMLRGILRDSVHLSDAAASIYALPSESALSISGNGLSPQFNSAVKFIKSRETLGQNRQLFFVTLGGFDTHSNQLASHANLMGVLSEALEALYSVLEDQGLASDVTTVTMSDFGRRITPNSSGTDHGWGSNHLVINGGNLTPGTTGTWPSLTYGGEDDYSSGRMLPTTSVDQIGATLANWMGVSSSNIDSVFPNLQSFSPQLLDFI